VLFDDYCEVVNNRLIDELVSVFMMCMPPVPCNCVFSTNFH